MAYSGLPTRPRHKRSGIAIGIATLASGVVRGLIARRERQKAEAVERREAAARGTEAASKEGERLSTFESKLKGSSREQLDYTKLGSPELQRIGESKMDLGMMRGIAAEGRAEVDQGLQLEAAERARRDQERQDITFAQQQEDRAKGVTDGKPSDVEELRRKYIDLFNSPTDITLGQKAEGLPEEIKLSLSGNIAASIPRLLRNLTEHYMIPENVMADPDVRSALVEHIRRNERDYFAASVVPEKRNKILETLEHLLSLRGVDPLIGFGTGSKSPAPGDLLFEE